VRLLALALAFADLAAGQAITNSASPTNMPNQVSVTTAWLYLNKMHYAGAWSSASTYSSQDTVTYSGSTYVSLQAGNLNQPPASSPSYWAPIGGGGAVASVFGRTGAVTAQTGDYTASQIGLTDVSNAGKVIAVQGVAVAVTAPTNGQVLTYNSGSSSYAPATPSSGSVTSVFGRTGVVTAQTGDYTASQIGLTDVSNAGKVIAIQGIAVNATAPTDGQVLKYSSGSSSYVPATPSSGSGCTVTGNAGRIPFDNGSTGCSEDSNLVWDSTNHYLEIGTGTATAPLSMTRAWSYTGTGNSQDMVLLHPTWTEASADGTSTFRALDIAATCELSGNTCAGVYSTATAGPSSSTAHAFAGIFRGVNDTSGTGGSSVVMGAVYGDLTLPASVTLGNADDFDSFGITLGGSGITQSITSSVAFRATFAANPSGLGTVTLGGNYGYWCPQMTGTVIGTSSACLAIGGTPGSNRTKDAIYINSTGAGGGPIITFDKLLFGSPTTYTAFVTATGLEYMDSTFVRPQTSTGEQYAKYIMLNHNIGSANTINEYGGIRVDDEPANTGTNTTRYLFSANAANLSSATTTTIAMFHGQMGGAADGSPNGTFSVNGTVTSLYGFDFALGANGTGTVGTIAGLNLGTLCQVGLTITNCYAVHSTDATAVASFAGPLNASTITASGQSGNVGQAACYKAGGTLGICSSVVGAGGACTCG
jgi:hypothetical protein